MSASRGAGRSAELGVAERDVDVAVPAGDEPEDAYDPWLEYDDPAEGERLRWQSLTAEQQAYELNQCEEWAGTDKVWKVESGELVRVTEPAPSAETLRRAKARMKRTALVTGGYFRENDDGTTTVKLGPLRPSTMQGVAALHRRGLDPRAAIGHLLVRLRDRGRARRGRRAALRRTPARSPGPREPNPRRRPLEPEAAA